ncbi:hypothetical protein MKX01_031404 [Papaver californicum]|nr:hypothetical protein MKX01_031404 [Papaver californicum]
MGASIIIFPLFLFCFLCLTNFTASAKNCGNNRCSKHEPDISYPFRIKGRQDKRCGFPGFDLICDNMSRTVLELPFSKPFFVDSVNYGRTNNKIQLRDPDKCLTRRFLNHLNLSGTPFIGINFTIYSFYNCSSNDSNYFPFYYYTRISCLSSSTHTVIATSPESLKSSWLYDRNSMGNCVLIATIEVPVVGYNPFYNPLPYDPYEETVLHLTWEWEESNCKINCNGSSISDQIDIKKFFISIGIIFPFLFASVMYCITHSDENSSSQDVLSRGAVQTRPLSVITVTSLGDSAIQSFPTVVLGASGRLPDPDINTCAICQSEYQPKEILKTLPGCNHCFHADCIDVWLHLKSTYPVCRKSSLVR